MPTTTETGPVRRRLHRPPNRPVQVRGSHLKWTKSRGLDIVIVIDHTVDSVGEYTPRLVDGARSCPPEDCGGFPGYDELVGVLADPTHEEYAERIEWLCGEWDPDAFDLAATNEILVMYDRASRQRRRGT